MATPGGARQKRCNMGHLCIVILYALVQLRLAVSEQEGQKTRVSICKKCAPGFENKTLARAFGRPKSYFSNPPPPLSPLSS